MPFRIPLFRDRRDDTPDERPALDDPEATRLTDQRQIHAMLEQIRTGHTLVAVHVMGEEGDYNSAILKLDPESGHIVFDELAPSPGEGKLVAGTRVRVTARNKGVQVRFDAVVTDLGEYQGLPFFRTTLPEEIRYIQRREHYRAPIPVDEHVTAQLMTDNDILLNADVSDLSVAGCNLRLRSRPAFRIGRGTVIPRCFITLPDEERIITSLEVRQADDWERTAFMHLRGRFLGLTRAERRSLQRYIIRLDRKRSRKLRLLGL
ncbi:MAG: hypothetical protein D6786_02420 [Gammaproteobacteria bacterium]|nr:MAG: hypothetical protein D6786_02420 [Gammaproteobacteria bacterium]